MWSQLQLPLNLNGNKPQGTNSLTEQTTRHQTAKCFLSGYQSGTASNHRIPIYNLPFCFFLVGFEWWKPRTLIFSSGIVREVRCEMTMRINGRSDVEVDRIAIFYSKMNEWMNESRTKKEKEQFFFLSEEKEQFSLS